VLAHDAANLLAPGTTSLPPRVIAGGPIELCATCTPPGDGPYSLVAREEEVAALPEEARATLDPRRQARPPHGLVEHVVN